MKKFGLILWLFFAFFESSMAQTTFVDTCLGNWEGTMYIYNRGMLKDSLSVKLTVKKMTAADAWMWKMEYLSPQMPMVKDYILRLKDASKGHYITDEGGGIELMDYLFENKLYCVFETSGVILTSTYELRGKELIFEVTSGKKQGVDNQPVTNYSVDNLQRVVFRKVE